MLTDKELLEEVRESFDMEPKVDFTKSTKQLLEKRAQTMKKRKQSLRFLTMGWWMALTATITLWVTVLGGKDFLISSFNTILTTNSTKQITPVKDEQIPSIFIYQTHNRESFFTEENTNEIDKAYHPERNISLIGQRIAKHLEKSGISVKYDDSDIADKMIKEGAHFGEAYEYSERVIKKEVNDGLSSVILLDIHRDSAKKEKTTTVVNGEKVARIGFVLSKDVDKSANNKFAKKIHERLEEKFPGVSRGIITKEGEGRSTYNQDLGKASVLVLIGGVENTLIEEYKTAEIFADVLKDVLNDVVK
ncbi:stage II sporulation protein P [Radiobacillus kanasensis]|uniref:stage II sporulation protein P n=1 Tax=Radiobacillus kanasensis TaxID=2844358 RepID=UPI001E28D499|nr:stage II sporulation protein P [Radiobacillus kanasensis]UFU01299.1 stage II sporulation protein P [Radiobacillus kanasensis]